MSLVYILIVYCPVDFFVGTLCDLDEHYRSTYHMHLVIPETKFAIIRMFIDHLDYARFAVSRIIYRPVYQILQIPEIVGKLSKIRTKCEFRISSCTDIGTYRRNYSSNIRTGRAYKTDKLGRKTTDFIA